MKNYKVLPLTLIITSIFLSSCKPTTEQISASVEETMSAWTEVPSSTHYPTYTQYPTQTPLPTIVIIQTKVGTITSTSTPPGTPTITPTETLTPKPTHTKSPTTTESPLTKDHYDGIYGVGIDIAPGKWQVNDPVFIGNQPDCYWARYNAIGNIIEDAYGQQPPFVITVQSTDTLVELDHCKRVIYLGP